MTCSVAECGKPVRLKGYCESHYRRQLRHGNPLAGCRPRGEAYAWLLAHTSYASDDCLIWPFYKKRGYGAVTLPGGKQTPASRQMCILAHGEPPSLSHVAAHTCGKGSDGCVNPRHLRWATQSENEADKRLHGTALLGERHPHTSLTESDVRAIRLAARQLSSTQIADLFGISSSGARAIIRGRTWRHV